jgi:hypothetical protein
MFPQKKVENISHFFKDSSNMLEFLSDGTGEEAVSLLLPQSQNRCRFGFRAGQTFLTLTRFIEILAIFVSSNKFIMKIDSIIYLMILIMYYKY